MTADGYSAEPGVLRLHVTRRIDGIAVTGFEISTTDGRAVVELSEPVPAPNIPWPADAARENAESALVGELRQLLPVSLQRVFTFVDALIDVTEAPTNRAAVDEAAGAVLRGLVFATYGAVGLAPLVPAVKYFADQVEDHVAGEAVVEITPDGAVAHPVNDPGLPARLGEAPAGPMAEPADEPEPEPPPKPAKPNPSEPPEPGPPPWRPPDPPGPGGWL